MNRPDPETFVLTLRAEAHVVPAITRLRAALKRLLKNYGLRCVDVRQQHQDDRGPVVERNPDPGADTPGPVTRRPRPASSQEDFHHAENSCK
jgi:hypothetical protein